jgi:DNA-binding XRE family transcriptional regulator
MKPDPYKTEIWKPIPGFEGIYEASSFGQIKSLARNITFGKGSIKPLPEIILKQSLQKTGYLRLWLFVVENGKSTGKQRPWSVHRLVLLTFVGPPPEGTETRHLDGNKTNNKLSNLMYGTKVENAADQVRHGKQRYGSQMHNAQLTEQQVVAIRQAYAKRDVTQHELAEKYGVSTSVIANITSGRLWKHAGGPAKRYGVRFGEAHGQSKLTEEAVRYIRKHYRFHKVTAAQLAKKFGVSRRTVGQVIAGKTWKHVK